MNLPMAVNTNSEFDKWELDKRFKTVEKFYLLISSIHINHDLTEGKMCKRCAQDKEYLIYTKQVECSKNPYRSSRFK